MSTGPGHQLLEMLPPSCSTLTSSAWDVSQLSDTSKNTRVKLKCGYVLRSYVGHDKILVSRNPLSEMEMNHHPEDGVWLPDGEVTKIKN